MMSVRNGRLRSVWMMTTALSLGALVALAMPAQAQDAAPAKEDAAAVQDVIITASKRSTKLLKTPLAVSALTQEALDKQGVENVRDLATTVPNLQMGSNGDSSTAISMRGVTSTDTTEVSEAAVSVHQDGFYSPRPQGALALMYDVERVEVLRGPQGTLFGMNSPGGVINVIPARPKFSQSFGSFQAGLGNYNSREIRAMYNFGISDTFAIRANIMATRHDGYGIQEQDFTDLASPANGIVKDGIPDVDQRYNHYVAPKDAYNNGNEWAARLIARWQPNDKLEIVGTISRFADNGAGDHDYVDCKSAEGTPAACNHPLRYLKINVPGSVRMTLDDYQLKTTYNISDSMVLEYRAGFEDERRHQLVDTDGGFYAPDEWSSIGEPLTDAQQATLYYPIADNTSNTRSSNYRSMTHELQLKSSGNQRLQYVLGTFYLYEHKQIDYAMDFLVNKSYDSGSGSLIDGLPFGVVFDQRDRTTESKALFAQFDYRATDTLSFTLGGRYSWDKKGDHNGYEYGDWTPGDNWYNGHYTPTTVRAHQSSDLTWDMGVNSAPNSAANPLSYVTDADRSWNQGTYRLGVQYNPSAKHMFFGSIATGYKMGGLYEAADFCANGCIQILEYGPEHVTNYEAGYKGKLFDNRLQLSATVFVSDYHDMQNTGDKVIGVNTNSSSPEFGRAVIAWTTDNLPLARIKGLELEFDAKPWANGELGGYLSWLNTEVVEGTLIDEYACGERHILGQPECGAPDVPMSIKGHHLPFAPELSLTVHYQHEFHTKSGYRIEPYVLMHWQSKMWLDVLNYDGAHLAQSQDSYTKFDANIRITPPDAKMFIEVYGDNLTDVANKNFQSIGQGALRASYDAPRTWGVRLGYTF